MSEEKREYPTELEKELIRRELALRRAFCAKILRQAMSYVAGYLRDYRIENYHDFTGNPLVLTIKVWWDLPEKQGVFIPALRFKIKEGGEFSPE